MVHGDVTKSGEEMTEFAHTTLVGLLNELNMNVRERKMTPEEGILIFQAAATADLPSTDEEKKTRFEALPADVQASLTDRTNLLKSLLMGSPFGIDVVTINGGSPFGGDRW